MIFFYLNYYIFSQNHRNDDYHLFKKPHTSSVLTVKATHIDLISFSPRRQFERSAVLLPICRWNFPHGMVPCILQILQYVSSKSFVWRLRSSSSPVGSSVNTYIP